MFGRKFRRDREAGRIASALYGAIVAQARSPALYTDLGVPDTVSGRFEMVVLHTVLVVERLKTGGAPERAIGQRVFDTFCADMDRSLRELGVGDLAVPKRMKQMAASFYGRAQVYGRSLAGGGGAGLAEAIGRNVFAGAGEEVGRPLANYAAAAAQGMARVPDGALLDAAVVFPDPTAFASASVDL